MNRHNTKLIRLPTVIERTGYSRSWIYELINQKQFPQPIKIGSRAVAFIEGEIDEWIEVLISKSRNETI
ncbi:helix-turn-helix transcriptional regulator [Pantoea agglomerans]|uniref:helix-turn-helix transcriptional regulator n=2 Tax=Enterobacter agglomerans TaxID=549 RepID=UPI000E20F8EE|nr:AlpA family transcriptional regulator [Pantoea agglomerans]MCH9407161.1 AlpA family transcriptional regulator [Pantoea agglomerans]QTC51688.1 AlpA family transcriptional regulator [Pantoea agglomerans]WNK31829.1 AlpA family transcriptional regulator [Pantoea agglomerans]WNK36451.1 AlpA family transcriptional regulator [Pantoea agglomerans]WNK63641.1 AlpA family transcriptional regulator [Pantoea agglomerans]